MKKSRSFPFYRRWRPLLWQAQRPVWAVLLFWKTMRRTRRLLLVAIIAVLALVGAVYFSQRRQMRAEAQPAPASLPAGIQAAARDWHWSRTINDKPIVEIRAKNYRQVGEKLELEGVELKLYQEDGKHYDRVVSRNALFQTGAATLYSEGEVEITMGLADESARPGRLIDIRSSGVTYDSKTGTASTDRLATFTLDTGSGQAIGARYDPAARELHLKSHVELHWKGRGPQSKTMKIEGGNLVYRENDSMVALSPWSRLTRGTMVLEAGNSNIELVDGAIRKVDAQKARGADTQPGRKLEYAAENLTMHFAVKGEIEKLTGQKNARLVSTSATGVTTATSDRVDLEFSDDGTGSTLHKAHAMGHATVESTPIARKDIPPPDTRVLRSETIELQMRPGGEEIDNIATHSPGKIEFLPNHPKSRRRTMDGERMSIKYGRDNQIESFRSVTVATRTEGHPNAKPAAPPQLTWSKDLKADFDPVSGQMAKLEQWNDFRFEEGSRRAKANRATLDASSERITLEGQARFWDPSGATSGDRIVLEQKTGDFSAEGKVASTRRPDNRKSSPGMLSGDAPMQARAQRMTSTDDNRRITYEGEAILWQGSNRIEAHRVDINRAEESLHAQGNVISQFPDAASTTGKKGRAAITIVKAPELRYRGTEKVAHYKGGVLLERPGLEVRSNELRAFIKEERDGTTLDRAVADGSVAILEKGRGRTRKGTGEHGEYYAGEEKLVLSGGSPLLVDSVKGSTSGKQLTYFAHTEKLFVDGAGEVSASRIVRR